MKGSAHWTAMSLRAEELLVRPEVSTLIPGSTQEEKGGEEHFQVFLQGHYFLGVAWAQGLNIGTGKDSPVPIKLLLSRHLFGFGPVET